MKKRPGFISLGAAAIIAGCGGGGSNGAPVARAVPPANPNSGPMTHASLRVQIPARGTKTARRRVGQWVSPSSTTLGVRVLASPLPNPTPTEDVFTIPTPGPVPTSFTVNVDVPYSDDTFVASVYDSSHNLLATGSSTPVPVTFTATPPPVSVTMLGVASGVQYTVSGSTPATWRVLENMGAPQTTTVAAQPVDADGNLIPGTLATPAALSGTNGVTLTPSSISSAGNVTATYPSGTEGSASITSPLALNTGASTLNAAVNADYYIFAADDDGSVYVIDGLTQTQVGPTLTGITSSQQIAAVSGCTTGVFAVSGNSNGAAEFSVAAPTATNPTPLPTATSLPATILSANPFEYGAAGDSHCDAFYNNGNSGYPVVKLSGFDSTVSAVPSFATGFQYGNELKSIGGNLYSVGNPSSDVIQAVYVSELTGGVASVSAAYSAPSVLPVEMSVAGTGSSVFLVGNTCGGQPVLQPLSGGSLITLTDFGSVMGAAEATDGTTYLVGSTTASAPVLAYAAFGNIATAPTTTLGGTPVDVAVTPDQQYVCVLENGSASGQIEFFRRTPTLSLVATVPLSASSPPDSFSIGP